MPNSLPARRPRGRSSPWPHGPAPAEPGGEPDGTVLEYLRSIRELVAAERDVMLRYLGAAPGTAPDLRPVIEAAAGAPLAAPVAAEAAAVPRGGCGRGAVG